ncbi:MAG: septum formation initiator family protein [Eubacteriales bacterium]|nr:septum formation initiator family protein [Eubacteriales bacterium]
MGKKRGLSSSALIRAAILLFCLFFAVQWVSLHLQVTDLRAQSAELDKEISRKELANKELQESQSESDSDEAIAKIARDVLGYASPGEKVYIDSSKQ